VKEAPLPEAHDVYALYLEGGLSAVELRTFLDRELPDWLATIDPVNAPALRNAEKLSARGYRTRRPRLIEAAKGAAARFDHVDVIAAPIVMYSPQVLADDDGPEQF
jgi:hypothetical protein